MYQRGKCRVYFIFGKQEEIGKCPQSTPATHHKCRHDDNGKDAVKKILEWFLRLNVKNTVKISHTVITHLHA